MHKIKDYFKLKVIIYFGYNGLRFHGLQKSKKHLIFNIMQSKNFKIGIKKLKLLKNI